MRKKNQPPEQIKTDEKKFKTFAYYLAWLSVLAAWGSAIVSAVRDKPPPDKDDYFK